jgi:hypothetical protein
VEYHEARGQRTHTYTHLHGSQGRATPQYRVHLARGDDSLRGRASPCPTTATGKGRQQVGHTEVRHHDVQRVQAANQDVGGPQVPVQDAQGVQVQQGSQHLLQQGEDTGQGQATL